MLRTNPHRRCHLAIGNRHQGVSRGQLGGQVCGVGIDHHVGELEVTISLLGVLLGTVAVLDTVLRGRIR